MRVSTNSKFKVIVHFEEDVISDTTLFSTIDAIQNKSIRELLAEYGAIKLKAAFTNRYDTTGFLKKNIKSSLPGAWQQIILSHKNKAEDLIVKLKKEKGVINAYIEHPIPISPCIAPTDPLYSSQWHLKSNSSPLADINAEQAWNINPGRNDVIIAVCDGGIDYTHPDLDPGNRSRVIAGYDFGSNDSDPMDDLPDGTGSYGGHGTHIAGIIGAIPNNGQQISGVMWNCKIMPVKMVGDGSLTISYPFGAWNWDFSTTAFPSDVADAIDYAVNNGAHVINLSYGFPDMGVNLNQVILRVPLLHEAILNAYNNNVVVIASMGNEYSGGNPTNYPAAFPDVIAVGNTTNDNPPQRWQTSSTGSHISVSAPGRSIISTTRGGGTGPKTGTSMSAPLVSGVAGLIISQGLDRNFNLTNDDVRHILERTAYDVTSTGVGFDNQTGYGIVDAYEALHLLDEPNELFHYNSTGGAAVKNYNFKKWILLSGRWGLAAGTYLKVDQYKITKHVTFDVPFCSTPTVWMREKESKSLSYANPNLGRPYCQITNITPTGFDLEYVVYFVPTNLSGQRIDKWIPASPEMSNVAYTAVGVPNFAANASLSGPSLICSSGASFSISNLPNGASINWNTSSNISRSSSQGSNPCTFTASGSGQGWVQATITTGCGDVILPRKNVWVGAPNHLYMSQTFIDGYEGACEGQTVGITIESSSEQLKESITSYFWDMGSWAPYFSTHGNNSTHKDAYFYLPYGADYNVLHVTATNACGTSYPISMGYYVRNCYSYTLSLSPNPSTVETTISLETIATDAKSTEALQEWDLEVYNQGQQLKARKQKINGSQATLNTSGWKEGVYIIRAKVNGEVLTEKLVVKEQ